jgi:hypothetical protein
VTGSQVMLERTGFRRLWEAIWALACGGGTCASDQPYGAIGHRVLQSTT